MAIIKKIEAILIEGWSLTYACAQFRISHKAFESWSKTVPEWARLREVYRGLK